MKESAPRKDMRNTAYDPAWPQFFEDLQRFLARSLGELILSIDHVGSTAVPNLSAKPIIDLDLVIRSNQDLPKVTECLEELGYTPQGDLGRPGREAFTRSGNDQVPYDGQGTRWFRHHLYVCPQDSPVLKEHLLFRDYLKTHPEAMNEYARLKMDLATQFPEDPEHYVEGKSKFIQNILAAAQAGLDA